MARVEVVPSAETVVKGMRNLRSEINKLRHFTPAPATCLSNFSSSFGNFILNSILQKYRN